MRQTNTCVALTVIVLLYWLMLFYPIEYPSKPIMSPHFITMVKKNGENEKKTVVFWTSFMGYPYPVDKALNDCPAQQCLITNDRTLVGSADAVVFHVRNMDYWDLPQQRTINQKYVFLLMESPILTFNSLRGSHNFFNWTMTYRKDSDIYYPYGLVKKRVKPLDTVFNYKAEIRTKVKLIAWFVSHCYTHSKRERVVLKLQKYVPVDIYGRCGPLKCFDNTKCHRIIETNYKFYLAFENAICNDYVTEKFFSIAKLVVVPIVLKRSTYRGIVPMNSFIAMDDFSTIKKLADYLLYLDQNDTAYQEYFHWKQDYEFASSSEYGFCLLCTMLTQEKNAKFQSYNDIRHWWYDKGGCQEFPKGNIFYHLIHKC